MKKIYINPGHSDTDSGAVGHETERRLNVAVSNHMKDYLLAHYDCEIRMNPGTMRNLTEIANDANQWGADLFVSNHFNSGGGDGYEALVYSQGAVELGKIFAKHVAAVGQNLRLYGAAPGVKLRPDLAVLRLTNMYAVLNEGAFVDNWKDIQDWNDDAELKKLGIAYAKAAAEFLGLPEKIVAKEPTKQEGPKPNTMNLPVLKKGAKGATVKAMQILLIGYGFSCGSTGADSSFGNKTDIALRLYQNENGLEVDGYCGPLTWCKLLGL